MTFTQTCRAHNKPITSTSLRRHGETLSCPVDEHHVQEWDIVDQDGQLIGFGNVKRGGNIITTEIEFLEMRDMLRASKDRGDKMHLGDLEAYWHRRQRWPVVG